MSQLDRVLLPMAVTEGLLRAEDLEAAVAECTREPAEAVLRRRGVAEDALARLVRKRDQAWSEAAARARAQLERQVLATAAVRRGLPLGDATAGDATASDGADLAALLERASPDGESLVRSREPQDLRCACGLSLAGVLVPSGEPLPACPSCDGPLGTGEAPPASAGTETAVLPGAPLASAGGATAVIPIGTLPLPLPDSESATIGSGARLPDPESATIASDPARRPASTSAGRSGISQGGALPAKVGPYATVRVLGQGGMGAVLEATDASGRAVAVKVIHDGFAEDGSAEARFQREGKVLSLLAHPNVVRYLDRGRSDGVTWIAMELVRGRSLADRIQEGPLPVGEAARIGRAVAEGLAYAHALGLVHRDVKPGNVLLGERGEVKLADFGLARRRDESLVLTQQGEVVGTPLYMAPEQLEGMPATPAVDLFALGAVLFHAAAGVPPFSGSIVQMAFQRSSGKRPRLRDKVPGVAPALDALVDRLLSRRPEDRPGAATVARELAKLETDSPATTPTETRPPVADPRTLSQGSKVGVFAIEAKLGAGGMGAVFRAKRPDGKAVALKIVAHGGDTDAGKRFAREARALAEVEHPNLVRFVDAGSESGFGWIAMELAPGQSLDALVAAKGPLSEERLLAVGDAVAAALEALHARGIVHRDVKPQNVMVGPAGEVTLVDLGLAKFLGAETAVTQAGALVGTPHYMAPEQLTGRPLDARTDLYALGATLYHAATGKRPFDGESTTAIAFQQVHAAARPVRALNPRLTPPFARVIDKLLSKRADRRPASAAEARRLFRLAREGKSPDGRAAVARYAGRVVAALVLLTAVLAGVSAATGRRGPLGQLISWTERGSARQAPQADSVVEARPQKASATSQNSTPGRAATPPASPGQVAPSPAPASNAPVALKERELAKDLQGFGGRDQVSHDDDQGQAPVSRPPEATILPEGGDASAKPSQLAAPSGGKPAPEQRPVGSLDEPKGRSRALTAKKQEATDTKTKPQDPRNEPPAERGRADELARAGSAPAVGVVGAVDSSSRVLALRAVGVELADGRYTRLSDGAPLVLVPAGTHVLGAPGATRTVELPAFLVDRQPVTVARWALYRQAKRAAASPDGHFSWCFPGEPATTDHRDALADDDAAPARRLTAWDAAGYARWAKARLPGADEWEAAARIPGTLERVAGVEEWTLDQGPTGPVVAARGGGEDASHSVPGEAVEDLATRGFRCVVLLPADAR